MKSKRTVAQEYVVKELPACFRCGGPVYFKRVVDSSEQEFSIECGHCIGRTKYFPKALDAFGEWRRLRQLHKVDWRAAYRAFQDA